MTSKEHIMVDLLLVANTLEEQGHGMHEKCQWKKTFRLGNQKVGQRGTRRNLLIAYSHTSASIYIFIFIYLCVSLFFNCVLISVNKTFCMLLS